MLQSDTWYGAVLTEDQSGLCILWWSPISRERWLLINCRRSSFCQPFFQMFSNYEKGSGFVHAPHALLFWLVLVCVSSSSLEYIHVVISRATKQLERCDPLFSNSLRRPVCFWDWADYTSDCFWICLLFLLALLLNTYSSWVSHQISSTLLKCHAIWMSLSVRLYCQWTLNLLFMCIECNWLLRKLVLSFWAQQLKFRFTHGAVLVQWLVPWLDADPFHNAKMPPLVCNPNPVKISAHPPHHWLMLGELENMPICR